ncbi:hypothetical protein AVEN_152837-1 [Araneus ventricosus]|uniref:Uncharacterized protein n=1 Tax=Araneus ventricosus TaxID=182803 RepID=A0A4Y2TLU3_ARAVE|nr:hypothetical protein AVEN_152837-1 [Araneus ventricosus]
MRKNIDMRIGANTGNCSGCMKTADHRTSRKSLQIRTGTAEPRRQGAQTNSLLAKTTSNVPPRMLLRSRQNGAAAMPYLPTLPRIEEHSC